MKYMVTGESTETGRKVSPGEFANILKRGIILDLQVFKKLGFKNKILTNGTPKKRVGVAIVHGESIKDIIRMLTNVPSWLKVKWTVSPLEKF